MQTPNMPILLADAHTFSRIGLVQVLLDAGFEVAAEAGSAEELLQLLAQHQPDLLLLACNLLPPDPLPFVTGLRQQYPSCPIVLFLANSHSLPLQALVDVGVHGLVLKEEPIVTLVQTVEIVITGNTFFSPKVLEELSTLLRAVTKVDAAPPLTEWELEALRLLAQGLSNHQLAIKLGITEQTVRNYLTKLYRKIDVHSRPMAELWARQNLTEE